MPAPTRTVLFLLCFFLACFVFSAHQLWLRRSVNSSQVLVSRCPATTAPAWLSPGRRCCPSPWGSTPGALEKAGSSQPGKHPTDGLLWVAALSSSTMAFHGEVCVPQEHQSHPLQERTPAPGRSNAAKTGWRCGERRAQLPAPGKQALAGALQFLDNAGNKQSSEARPGKPTDFG